MVRSREPLSVRAVPKHMSVNQCVCTLSGVAFRRNLCKKAERIAKRHPKERAVNCPEGDLQDEEHVHKPFVSMLSNAIFRRNLPNTPHKFPEGTSKDIAVNFPEGSCDRQRAEDPWRVLACSLPLFLSLSLFLSPPVSVALSAWQPEWRSPGRVGQAGCVACQLARPVWPSQFGSSALT